MKTQTKLLFVTVTLLPLSLALGHGSGIISGKQGDPRNLATAFPSCGNCHNAFPNFNVKFTIDSAMSVAPGSNVAIKATVGGANLNSTRGGFTMEASDGSFVAGLTTRIDTTNTGRAAITHVNTLQRDWSFAWTAPTIPGLVQIFATGNAVDGDGRNTGDAWGWYGPMSNVPGTPHRIFVNEASVTASGEGCPGTDGFKPILGMKTAPALGAPYVAETHTLPPTSVNVPLLGLSDTAFGALPLPLPLQGLGGGTCVLRVSIDITQAVIATGSGTGNGVANAVWGIPNQASLRGLRLHHQTMTVDPNANALGFTFSNALTAAVQ